MKNLALVTIAAVCAMTCGSARAADLRTLELPALSVSLPEGRIVRQSKLAGTGTLEMSLDDEAALESLAGKLDRTKLMERGARQINVQWDAFPLSSDAERTMVLNAVIKALPIRNAAILREESLSEQRKVYVVGLPEVPIAVSFIDCAEGRGVTVSLAFTRDIDVLVAAAGRVARSVVCKAVTAAELPKAAYRLPKNFGRRPEPGMDMFMSLEGEVLVSLFAAQDVQRMQGMFVKVLGSMMGGILGIPEDQVSLTALDLKALPDQPSITAVMKTSGDLDGAIVNVRYCEAQELSLIVLWYADGGEQDLAVERIRQVGCPGEPTEPVATMADLFGGECQAGNQFACDVLKNLDSL